MFIHHLRSILLLTALLSCRVNDPWVPPALQAVDKRATNGGGNGLPSCPAAFFPNILPAPLRVHGYRQELRQGCSR